MSDDLKLEVKQLIVRSLRLTISPEEIQSEMTLFGGDSGLGLDSVDALELILELDRTYGVKVKDEAAGRKILRSVDTIAEAIEEARTEAEKTGIGGTA